MPISPIVLQRRHAELGRIRLGQKGDRGQPQKLGAFRFTSPSLSYIRDLAEIYGGTAQPWDNNGKPEFEVFTTATSIPVIAVKGALSQWMETWSGGGCVHRCDGERTVEGDLCENDTTTVTIKGKTHRAHDVAKPTTRLSLMLPELEAIGVWRLETHGWNAAAEIPAVAELAQFVGELVPAHLHLVERRAIKDGKTSRFVVPVLDLQIGTARLREVVSAKMNGETALGGPEQHVAIEAGKGGADQQPAAPLARETLQIPTPEQINAADLPTLRKMLDYLVQHDQGQHPAAQAARKRIDWLEDHEDDQQPQPDADGAVDADIVEDDADAVWEHIVRIGGRQGMTLSELQDGFSAFSGGLLANDVTAGELGKYLEHLRAGEQVSA